MEQQYDVIIIGAGHNGLILGNYLAKGGRRVLILESRLEAGGGLSTEEVTVPGFWHNLHSYFHDTINIMPAYTEIGLENFDAKYYRPPVQAGVPLKDGRALLMYDDIERTTRSIARFSERDARTWRQIQDEYADFMQSVVVPAFYSPPPPPSQQVAVLEGSPEGLDYLRLSRMSPRDVVDEFFESDVVKALVLHQLPIPRGMIDDYNGIGFVVPLIVSQIEHSQLCIGGSHALAHALWRAYVRNGGEIQAFSHVTKILLDGGAAVGVETRAGDRYYAPVIASSIDLKTTFLALVGEEDIDAELARKVRSFRLDEFSIFSVHMALNEAPRFKAAKFDPDVDRAFRLDIGFESPDDFSELWADIRAGRLPRKPRLFASVPTVHDPSQAPPGKHTAFLWQLVPYDLKGMEWADVKREFMDRCVEAWREYAPNLNDRNIIMKVAMTPREIPAKIPNMVRGGVFMGRTLMDQIEYFRPLPELSQYRTPVPGLYLCGASSHPGGGIIGAAGFVAANVIADDTGMHKWWEA